MPDLEHLWRASFARATELVAMRRPPPSVAWVRVMTPRVPAFDALADGDLALIPGSALTTLAAAGVEPSSIVAALAEAKAAGALVLGRAAGDAIDDLRASASQAGLALWRSDEDDVPAAERRIVAFLISERAAIDRRASDLEADVGRSALAGADLAAQLAIVAASLGRAVAIEGASAEPLAVHAPDDPAAAAAAAGYLANRRQVLFRTALPGPAGEPSGALVVLGEPPATEFERIATSRLAALLAIALARDVGEHRVAATARRGADALPGDGPPWIALMARQLVPGEAYEPDDRIRVRERIARLAPARRLRLRGDAGSLELRVIVAATLADPLGLVIAGQVAERMDRVVAVSRPFDRAEDRPLAEQAARATLEAVEATPSALSDDLVVRADRLPVIRLLGGLHNLPDGLHHARELLAPILTGRPATRAQRLATLRAVIEQPGLAEAARSLGVHRNTLAYRIRRIEAASGWRLDEPDLRIALALAVRLVQNDQRSD